MQFKDRLQDYTQAEFVSFLNKIWAVDVVADEHDLMVEHFDRLTAHIRGADLLFYPDTREQWGFYRENETALGEILAWYGVQKQPVFKDDVSSASGSSPDTRGRAQRELDLAVTEIAELDGQQQSAQTLLDDYERRLDEADKRGSIDQGQILAQQSFAEADRYFDQMDELRSKVVSALNRYKMAGVRLAFPLNMGRRLQARTTLEGLEQRKLDVISEAHKRYQAHEAELDRRHQALHERAEPIFKRTRDDLVRLAHAAKSGPLRERQTLLAPLSRMDRHPRLLASDPTRFEPFDSQWRWLSRGIRSALAGLTWELDAPDKAIMSSILGFTDKRPGCGDPLAFSVPLRDLMPSEGEDWQYLALAQARVDMPYRVSIAMYPMRHGRSWDGLREILEQANVCVVRTVGHAIASGVRVRLAVWDEPEQAWRLDCPDGRQREVLWHSHSKWAQLVDVPESVSRGSHFAPRGLPEVENADLAAIQLDDYIVVFPESSGIEPVYLSFKPRGEYPGVVVGRGQLTSADWLSSPLQRSAVPSQVAGVLQGQVFDRFRPFLAVFWQAVASFPELCTGFAAHETQAMALGQVSGLSRNFRIGFIRSPLDGGNVYDLDNLQIVRTG